MRAGPGELLVGAAMANISPPVGCPMGGYSARKGLAERVAAPLMCRAFVFDDGATPLAVVSCDLLYATFDMVTIARRLIGEALGWPGSSVMVNATHTHSGPAGLTLGLDSTYVELVARQVASAVATAYRDRRPALLEYSEARVGSLGRNRRDPEGPAETTARFLIAEAVETGGTIATIISYACHATVLEHDNLAISPDFPGAAVAVVEQLVGGQAAYLQGCAGSINPVWMRHDHGEAARLGRILGTAAARAVDEARPLGRGQWVVNLSRAEDVPVDPTGCRLVEAGPLSSSSTTVKLTRKARKEAAELEAAYQEVLQALGAETDEARRQSLAARRAALQMEVHFASHPYRYATRNAPGAGDRQPDEVEVQVLRLGPSTAIVGLPGEPFLGIADQIRQRAGDWDLIVAGYANEAIGYVPTANEFSFDGYEVGCARYTEEAAQALVEGVLGILGPPRR
ncbi:MAG: neutral/alkaline non-lysosomal ceramidase N-terminal domain-containing protein [Acidimicrobiales bacterium]